MLPLGRVQPLDAGVRPGRQMEKAALADRDSKMGRGKDDRVARSMLAVPDDAPIAARDLPSDQRADFLAVERRRDFFIIGRQFDSELLQVD